MRHARAKAVLATITGGAIAVTAAVTGAAPAASADSWSAPRVERVISGPSYPGIAAWGLGYNSVTGELIVGDYVSAQVRRYTLDGKYLGDFQNPKGNVEGVASAIAIDQHDGSVYVAITGEGKTSESVRKYDRNGNFLFDFALSGSVTWIALDDQGHLWVPGAFSRQTLTEYRVDPATQTATRMRYIGTQGSGPGQFGRLTGVDVDSSGRVYVADVANGTVHVFGDDGNWQRDLGDKSIFKGDIRGIAVDDATSKVYIANSQSGTIEVYDTKTWTRLAPFSGIGDGPSQFVDGARQLAIGPGGHLFAADYGSFRVVEFTPSGDYVSSFPKPAQTPDVAGLTSPRTVNIDPTTGDVLLADAWGQRIQRFATDGTLKEVWGRRGSFLPAGMNYPKSIAADPATGNVWVGNYEGVPNLVVYKPTFANGVVKRIPTPRFLSDIDFAGNLVYVTIRNLPSQILVLDRTTYQTVRTLDVSSLKDIRGTAVDPVTGKLWVAAGATSALYIVNQTTGAIERTVPTTKPGWGLAIVGDEVYVAEPSANAVQVISRTAYSSLGSFGSPGSAPGQMRGPSAVAADGNGRIYVVEDRNARVQVFTRAALPGGDTSAPTLTWTGSPNAPAGPLAITGRAADSGTGVLQVEARIKDTATGLYWNGRNATWTSAITWSPAISWGAQSSPSWRYTLVSATSGHSYAVSVRATDASGNRSKELSQTFTSGS